MDYQKNLIYFTGEANMLLLGIGYVIGGYGLVRLIQFIQAMIDGATINDTAIGIFLCFVLLPMVIGYFCVSKGVRRFPVSDADYEKAVLSYSTTLKSRALHKLGVDESEVYEIAPIILGGYEFKNADEVKQGKDWRWRSNIYKVVMLFFTRNEMHCYTAIFKTTEHILLGEATDVYFYQDIVSASTASVSDKIEVNDEELILHSEAFKLTTKGGTSITVNLLNSRHGQESVNAMRALLREKKQA